MTVLPIILTSTGLTAASSPSPAAAPAGAYISADFCNTLCKLTCDVKMGTSCSNAETVQNEYLEACGQDCTNLVRLNNTGDLVVDGDIRGQNVGGTNSVFTGGLNYDTATLTLNNSGIVAAKGVQVTDGSYSLISSKGPFTNFTLKSSATSDDTDLVLGNKDNTLNLLGSLNLVATPSAPSGALTVASGITGQGTLSVGSSSTFGGQMVSNATGGLVMNAGSISVKRMTANGHVFLDVDSNGWPVLISKDYCANTSDKYPGCLSDSGS